MDQNTPPPPAYNPVPAPPSSGYTPSSQAPQGEAVAKRPHAAAAAAVGITLMISMCIPVIGVLVASVAGIVFGSMGLKSDRRGLAITGIVLSVLVLVGFIALVVLYGAVVFSTLSELGDYSGYTY